MQKSGCSIEMQKITFNKKGQEIMHNQDQIIQWIGLIIVYIYIFNGKSSQIRHGADSPIFVKDFHGFVAQHRSFLGENCRL
jgi:hypothetical protein